MWGIMQLQKYNAAKTVKVKMQLQDLFFILVTQLLLLVRWIAA